MRQRVVLYGPNGRPLMGPSGHTPAYNSTGGGRATAGWNPGSEAINALVSAGGDALRRQSRDLDRRNAWARNAVDSFVSNAIGTGIVPRWSDPEARRRLEPAWLRWTDESDASGFADFYGLQALAAGTTLVAGECLARFRWRRKEDGLTVPLQIQLLEPEHLPLHMNQPVGGNRVRWGIEFDAIGRRVAYHLYREHPGEVPMLFPALSQARVPARDVVHLYRPRRPGQHRGEPWFAPVILQLWELEQYDRAELVRKGLAAMMAFFERDMDSNSMAVLLERSGDVDDDGQTPIVGIEPGSYIRVPFGKTIESPQFKDLDGMYPVFLAWQLRKIAAGVGITYEQLTGDYSKVNYSSARAALLEFRRRCEAFQHLVMVYQFCRPVLRAFVEAAALAGVIDVRDYVRRPRAYLDVEWSPPKWPWVDPLKDLQAEKLAVDELFKSRSEVIKQTSGKDRESLDIEIQEDQESEQEKGLVRRGKAGVSGQGRREKGNEGEEEEETE